MKNFSLLITVLMVLAMNIASAKQVTEGDKAPDFQLYSQNNQLVKLSDYKGKNVVLYFYPKDDAGFCLKEACAFRDSYDVFTDEGAVVIGISGDSVESHKKFAEKRKLPFVLLSDKDHKIAQEYGIGKWAGLLYNRVTFVIDKDGIIRSSYKAMLSADDHVDDALKVLKTL